MECLELSSQFQHLLWLCSYIVFVKKINWYLMNENRTKWQPILCLTKQIRTISKKLVFCRWTVNIISEIFGLYILFLKYLVGAQMVYIFSSDLGNITFVREHIYIVKSHSSLVCTIITKQVVTIIMPGWNAFESENVKDARMSLYKRMHLFLC